MRRDQHPFVGEGIQSAVRIFREFQMAASQHSTTSRDWALSAVGNACGECIGGAHGREDGPPGFAVAGQPRWLSLHELVRRAGGVCRVTRFIEEADEQPSAICFLCCRKA